MIKNLVILQARMSSSRLPGKVLKEVNGMPILYWHIQRIKQAKKVDKIIVATSTDKSDDKLVDFLLKNKIPFYRGSLTNVFSRYLEIAREIQPKVIVRLTADCPLFMPNLLDEMLEKFEYLECDYYSNIDPPSFPDGLDIEIMKTETLVVLSKFDLNVQELEHVTLGIRNRKDVFNQGNFAHKENLSKKRWTLDTLSDLYFIQSIYGRLIGSETQFNFQDVLDAEKRINLNEELS